MVPNPKYGPYAQTCEQRAYVLRQMLIARERNGLPQSAAYAQELHARYVAGELSWAEVETLLKTPPATALNTN